MKLLFFKAQWCTPCNQMEPIVAEIFQLSHIAECYPDVEHIDIDSDWKTSSRWKVQGIPTFIIVDNAGNERSRHSGAWAKNKMIDWLSDNFTTSQASTLTTTSNDVCNINFRKDNSMIKSVKKMLGMSGTGEGMMGSISTFAGYYAPMGFMDCDGRLLQVKDYPALFSILSTTYGGDGVKTFALPDLRPFANDGQPDTGRHRRVDWNELKMPRQVMCVNGIYPTRD